MVVIFRQEKIYFIVKMISVTIWARKSTNLENYSAKNIKFTIPKIILKLILMKFNTILPKELIPYFNQEIEKFHVEYSNNNLNIAWNHLERAHIIGQKYPIAHTNVHWKMLKFGFKIKSSKEILGQIPRLIFGGVKSFVGKIPIGNPGGSNVPPLKAFPIDDDLKMIFKKAGISYN